MRLHRMFSWSPLWLVAAGLVAVSLPLAMAVAQERVGQGPKTESIDVKIGERNTTDPGRENGTKTVTLTIDYGDGFQKRFVNIRWRKGMTVLDAMQSAKRHKRAQFDFTYRGRGATALLSKIDDVGNEGGGKRNWIYSVNKQKGDRSFGICKLHSGDAVLWRFETYL